MESEKNEKIFIHTLKTIRVVMYLLTPFRGEVRRDLLHNEEIAVLAWNAANEKQII